MQPWKKSYEGEKRGAETKRTCVRCEIKKENQARELWSDSGGKRGAWEHPSLSTGIEKVGEMGTGRHFEAICANAFITQGKVNLGRSYR